MMELLRGSSAPSPDQTTSRLIDERSGYASTVSALERLERLQHITAGLSEAMTLNQVADVMVGQGLLAVGARAASVSILSRDRADFYVLRHAGFAEIVQEHWKAFPANSPVPVADAVSAKETLEFRTAAERNARYPHLAHLLPLGAAGSSLVIPLFLKGGLVAALELFFDSAHVLTPEDRSFIRTVADLLAQALDRARLYDAACHEVAERELIQTALEESEERFRLLVEGAKDHAIFMLTVNNRVATWNACAARTLGYLDHEIIGRSAAAIFTPEERALGIPEDEMAAAIRDGRSESVRWHVRKDGAHLWCESIMTPLYYPSGELRGFEKVLRDITERKRQEDELLHQLSLTEAITNNAVEALFLTDDENRVTYLNPSAERTFGWTRDELLGCVLTDVMRFTSPSERPRLNSWCPFTDALQSGMSIQDHEDMFRRKNGSFIPVSCSYVPIIADGMIKGAVMAVRDITERRQNEQMLREAAARERQFLREVLSCVTEGKLQLCDSPEDLPPRHERAGDIISLTATGGIRELRHLAEAVSSELGIPEPRRIDLMIAVGETAMNAVVHAGGGLGQVFTSPDGFVQVWLEDHGGGIAVENLPRATLERGYSTANTLGHGFLLMLASVDYVWLLTSTEGTTIVLQQNPVAPIPSWLRGESF